MYTYILCVYTRDHETDINYAVTGFRRNKTIDRSSSFLRCCKNPLRNNAQIFLNKTVADLVKEFFFHHSFFNTLIETIIVSIGIYKLHENWAVIFKVVTGYKRPIRLLTSSNIRQSVSSTAVRLHLREGHWRYFIDLGTARRRNPPRVVITVG